MFIVITTKYNSANGNGFTEYQESAFRNEKNYLPNEITKLLEKHKVSNRIIPELYYMKNMGQNPNIFLPPNREQYYVSVSEISLNYSLPPDCYETGKDIQDFLDVVTKRKRNQEAIDEMRKRAEIEITERQKWINEANEFFNL